MSVQVIALGRHEQQAGCEEKLIAKTCAKCGAPLRSNKCEYCGTEYRMSDDEREREQWKNIKSRI